jgi:hypothetical protein
LTALADPRYLDISVPPGQRKTLQVEVTRHAFAPCRVRNISRRVRSGLGRPIVGRDSTRRYDNIGNRSLVLFDRGDVTVQAGDQGCASAGLGEADRGAGRVAWPIVMNTRIAAAGDVRHAAGTFIKRAATPTSNAETAETAENFLLGVPG